jgi:hypothetical protein
MAFWGNHFFLHSIPIKTLILTNIHPLIVIAGVEIKPGKPFTHTYDGSKGRLHISMVITFLLSLLNA